MTWGHFILTFIAGALFALALTAKTDTEMLTCLGLFALVGLVNVWWTARIQRLEREEAKP